MTTEVSTPPSFDVTKLHNIVMCSSTQQPHPRLRAVLWELASKNPMWQFKGQSKDTVGHERYFMVTHNSEILGRIYVISARGRNYQNEIAVACKRIEDQLVRKKAYQTNDDSKAIAKVRKFFAPKKASEIAEEAAVAAIQVAATAETDKRREIGHERHQIREKAISFFHTEEGRELFVQYLRRTNNLQTLEKMDAVSVMEQEMLTISGVRAKMNKNTTALVVIDEGKYLVKVLEDLNLYDDTTLPVDIRGKLGLLKLVNPRQFVSSAGFRVSEEVFVIDLEAQ